MRIPRTLCWAALGIALVFVLGPTVARLGAQTATDANSWEINLEDLQDVGLHMPLGMPSVRALGQYQKELTTHQELLIDWDPHTGYDHTVFREQVDEKSLKHEFAIKQRKTDVRGNAVIQVTAMYPFMLKVAAVTNTGEVRALASGPSLLVQPDVPPRPGSPPQEVHEYIKGPMEFWIALPDDPKIESIAFLLVQSDGKPRLKKVGTIVLAAKPASKWK